MCSETERAHRAFTQLGEQVVLVEPVTFLSIGAAETRVLTGSAPDDITELPLALGYEATATRFFHHLPPTQDEMERAIMTVEDIERLYKRFEQVMLGRPASWEAIPLDNAFSTRLLILREFMHHLGFLSVFIACPPQGESSITLAR